MTFKRNVTQRSLAVRHEFDTHAREFYGNNHEHKNVPTIHATQTNYF